jgi:hypothetical protein
VHSAVAYKSDQWITVFAYHFQASLPLCWLLSCCQLITCAGPVLLDPHATKANYQAVKARYVAADRQSVCLSGAKLFTRSTGLAGSSDNCWL